MPSNLINHILKKFDVLLSKQYVDNLLNSHPNYPSFLSYSDTFTHLGIDNIPVKLDNNELNQVKEFPIPFIAHVESNYTNDFVIVEKYNDDEVQYFQHQKLITETTASFLKKWTRIALLLYPNDTISPQSVDIEVQKSISYQQLQKGVLISLGILLLILGLYHSFMIDGMVLMTLVLFKLIGLGISTLLELNRLNIGKELTHTLCNISGSDCDEVIHKKEAKLFGILNWSELGFLYFSFGTLLLFFTQQLTTTLSVLAILNGLTIAFIPYSLYYQWRLAKSWCVLCLSTLAVFVVEGVLLWVFYRQFLLDFSLTFYDIILYIMAIALPMVILFLYQSWIGDKTKLQAQIKASQNIKYNPTYFEYIMAQQPKKEMDKAITPIMIENSEANYTVTIITNPYCGPCRLAHQEMEYFLNRPNMYDHIQFQLIFAVGNDTTRKKYQAAEIMLENYLRDKVIGIKSIRDWYEQKTENKESWLKQYTLKSSDETKRTLSQQNDWCKSVKITHTPTVLINGFELAKEYSIKDLKYLLE